MRPEGSSDVTDCIPAVRAVASKLIARLPRTGVYDVDDLAQEGMMRVIRAESNGGIDSAEHRFAQANTAAKFGMIDHLRTMQDLRRAGSPAHFISLDEPEPGSDTDRIHLLPSPGIGPLQQAVQAQSLVALNAAIERLDERQQTVLRLYYIEERSQDEIATLLCISRGRVGQLLRTTLIELRQATGAPSSQGCKVTAQSAKARYKHIVVHLTERELEATQQQAASRGVSFRKHVREAFLAGLRYVEGGSDEPAS